MIKEFASQKLFLMNSLCFVLYLAQKHHSDISKSTKITEQNSDDEQLNNTCSGLVISITTTWHLELCFDTIDTASESATCSKACLYELKLRLKIVRRLVIKADSVLRLLTERMKLFSRVTEQSKYRKHQKWRMVSKRRASLLSLLHSIVFEPLITDDSLMHVPENAILLFKMFLFEAQMFELTLVGP